MSWFGKMFGVRQASPPYVSLILGGEWRVKNAAPLKSKLSRLGIQTKREGSALLLRFGPEKTQQAEAARQLIGLGVAFSAGPASPSDVLGLLQAEGLLGEPYTEIYWSGPAEWHTRTVG
ncbi:hypothetical protein [Caulobacter sp. 17J80-11]|uniref:hypothetical protein n=1 Tax=Caulobacter sp. 17J80-11 TaxID=2763502 RepID=UPI0016534FD6|nr:hypothetical protein [Caulobacter sp. 17J80-11]MBC6981384.1 hypothetical protein [Caulobacter sp. 17J80-11]